MCWPKSLSEDHWTARDLHCKPSLISFQLTTERHHANCQKQEEEGEEGDEWSGGAERRWAGSPCRATVPSVPLWTGFLSAVLVALEVEMENMTNRSNSESRDPLTPDLQEPAPQKKKKRKKTSTLGAEDFTDVFNCSSFSYWRYFSLTISKKVSWFWRWDEREIEPMFLLTPFRGWGLRGVYMPPASLWIYQEQHIVIYSDEWTKNVKSSSKIARIIIMKEFHNLFCCLYPSNARDQVCGEKLKLERETEDAANCSDLFPVVRLIHILWAGTKSGGSRLMSRLIEALMSFLYHKLRIRVPYDMVDLF